MHVKDVWKREVIDNLKEHEEQLCGQKFSCPEAFETLGGF